VSDIIKPFSRNEYLKNKKKYTLGIYLSRIFGASAGAAFAAYAIFGLTPTQSGDTEGRTAYIVFSILITFIFVQIGEIFGKLRESQEEASSIESSSYHFKNSHG